MSSLPRFPIILDRIKSTSPECSKLCLTLDLPAIQSCSGHVFRSHFAESRTEGAIRGSDLAWVAKPIGSRRDLSAIVGRRDTNSGLPTLPPAPPFSHARELCG